MTLTRDLHDGTRGEGDVLSKDGHAPAGEEPQALAMGVDGAKECLGQRCWGQYLYSSTKYLPGACALSAAGTRIDRIARFLTTFDIYFMGPKAWRFAAQPTLVAKTSSSTMTPGLEDTSARHLKT